MGFVRKVVLTEVDFSTVFGEVLESWFSAEIACCDSCYDSFVGTWPAVYQRDGGFQSAAMPLRAVYGGSSDLRRLYGEKQFFREIKKLNCPRCGNALRANIWPYELPFKPPRNFERILAEIESVCRRTPSLLLTNKYARKTLVQIRRLALETSLSTLPPLYRGRVVPDGKSLHRSEFGIPPNAIVKNGRYNHERKAVLYLSTSVKTCFYELHKPATGFYTAEIIVSPSIKILDLTKMLNIDGHILQSMVWSALLSSPNEGAVADGPSYIFSRFVADCALEAGFQAIKYPSVRLGTGDNYVLLDRNIAEDGISITSLVNGTPSEFDMHDPNCM